MCDHRLDIGVMLLLRTVHVFLERDNLGPDVAAHPAKDGAEQVEELVDFPVARHVTRQTQTCKGEGSKARGQGGRSKP